MSLKEDLMPLQNLSSFQRKQMDPNADWFFGDTECLVNNYTPPCPNGGSDVSYLLRYLVKKYNWLSNENLDGKKQKFVFFFSPSYDYVVYQSSAKNTIFSFSEYYFIYFLQARRPSGARNWVGKKKSEQKKKV